MSNIFVTYTDHNFFDIVYWLVKSLSTYSKNKIILYVLNETNTDYDLPSKYDEFNITVRKIYTNEHIWTSKYTVMIDSLVNSENDNDNYVYIDGDTIVNYSINDVFKYSENVKNIPLLSLHPEYLLAASKIHPILPPIKKCEWGHADIIWYNKNCINFFNEGKSIALKQYGISDEDVTNHLQDKYNFLVNIHFMTPFYTLYKLYINNEKDKIIKKIGVRKNGNLSKLSIHLFHGCKDVKECEKMYNELVEFNNKNPNSQICYSV